MEIGPRDARTIAAVNGIATDSAFGAVTPPIYLSSNYVFPALEAPGAFEYSRTANPTRSLLSETLTLLEGAAGAVVTSSGMAAINLLLDQLNPGQKVVAPHDCYGGVYRLLASRQAKGHFDVQFVDQSDHASVARACSPTVTLVLIETPSNPLMRVTDIGAIAEIAHSAGAKVAVDNTFLSPALQRPIAHGADFVVHSTTKYLNGHSDVVGGVVVAANAADVEPLRDWANLTGVTGSPFDSYLTLRGIRSLFARIERQQITAMALAEFLEAQPQVSAVHYPGLASHSAYGLACRQQLGFGAMLSFDLHGGLEAVRRFVSNIRLITLAESLGGVESLIAHPATMTHASMGAEARLAAGIGDGLLRMSVGLESERDLKIDLAQAFTAT
ncbi:cystathionine gamma-synthase [Ensifer sp. 2YAB10]|uniref:cystathionine gamma-synthase n=1 Tax=unclassified Ensifer TaxID=2633371 RepID=UPI003F921054